MKFRLGNEVEADLNIKEMLMTVAIAVVGLGGLALFKALLMMI